MIEAVKSELRLELQAFSRLGATNKLSSITDSYTRILAIVQAIMVSSDNPDAHARAWSLINDDAYKYLVEVQEGRINRIEDLKFKISQVGELLLNL